MGERFGAYDARLSPEGIQRIKSKYEFEPSKDPRIDSSLSLDSPSRCAVRGGGTIGVFPDITSLRAGGANNEGTVLLRAKLTISNPGGDGGSCHYATVDCTLGALIPVPMPVLVNVELFQLNTLAWGTTQVNAFPAFEAYVYGGPYLWHAPKPNTYTVPGISILTLTESAKIALPPFAKRVKPVYYSALGTRATSDSLSFYGRQSGTLDIGSYRFSQGGSPNYEQGADVPNGATYFTYTNAALSTQDVCFIVELGV